MTCLAINGTIRAILIVSLETLLGLPSLYNVMKGKAHANARTTFFRLYFIVKGNLDKRKFREK